MVSKADIAIGGVLTAGIGLLVASSTQDQLKDDAADSCLKTRPRKSRLTIRQARALIKKAFPASQNRNCVIHLTPFSATEAEMHLGVNETRVGAHANRRKFEGHIKYWKEGVSEELFLHEIGHLKDDYEVWLSTRENYGDKMEQLTYRKMASHGGFGFIKRVIHGDVLLVEEKAWDQVDPYVKDKRIRMNALESYRRDRKAGILAAAGVLLILGGSGMAGYQIAEKSRKKKGLV